MLEEKNFPGLVEFQLFGCGIMVPFLSCRARVMHAVWRVVYSVGCTVHVVWP